MFTISKAVSATIIFITFVINTSFAQTTHVIELSIDPGTGLLLDPGTTEVDKGDSMYWKIKIDENIRSLQY